MDETFRWDESGRLYHSSESNEAEEIVRFRALMDQGRAAAIELAHATAAFYRTLIEDGVDARDAAELTREYVAQMLTVEAEYDSDE